MSNCTSSSLIEAKSVLLKTGNAVLSHRQVGKVEACWTVLGTSVYQSYSIIIPLNYRYSFISFVNQMQRFIYLFTMGRRKNT